MSEKKTIIVRPQNFFDGSWYLTRMKNRVSNTKEISIEDAKRIEGELRPFTDEIKKLEDEYRRKRQPFIDKQLEILKREGLKV